MKTLESGHDKIQKICDKLRRETLEPAQEEAQAIIAEANKGAEEIIREAENHAERIIREARTQIEQERNVFRSSLEQSSKQVIASLKQEIEHKIFDEELQVALDRHLTDPALIAKLINGIVLALERDGLSANLSVEIPKTVSASEVNTHLIEKVRKRLQDGPLPIGTFAGGIQVKLLGKRMTIDLSDQAIKELVSSYARKDFREFIFGSGQ